ncbi:MAG: putative competence protein ComEC [Actinomycetota bacterium]
MVVVVELDGKRFETWAYGRHRRAVGALEAGDRVRLAGTRSSIAEADARRRSAVRHVLGRFRIDLIADVRDGSLGAVAANRVRALLRSSAERSMDARYAALFTGLVIGDDARQDPSMVEAFRDAGLSHLTAVSGQNVAFVLLAAGPLLRRLSPWLRWCSTLALIAGFAAVARGEPSVLRAGVMAALSVTAFTVGRPVHPLRLLGLAVTGLVLVDPFLVHSVGFWLSVGATAGVCALSPVVERRLPGPRWLAMPLSLTIAAQAGVAIPALVVFGRLPAVALLANPAASAVAGFVMLAGIPSAVLSAVLSALGAPSTGDAVMWPVAVGTRWVADVAGVAAALPLPAAGSIAAWTVLAAWLALRRPRTPVPI